MGLAGAAGGASNVIKQILAERALAQQQQIENTRAEAVGRRADQSLALQKEEAVSADADRRRRARLEDAGIAVGQIAPGQELDPQTASLLQGTPYAARLQTQDTLPAAFGDPLHPQTSAPRRITMLRATPQQEAAQGQKAARIKLNQLIQAGAPRNQILAAMTEAGEDVGAAALTDPNAVRADTQRDARDMAGLQHQYRLGEIAAQGAQTRETAAAKTEPQGPSAYSQERAKRTQDSITELRKQIGPMTTGFGSLLSSVPTSPAKHFAAQMNTLKANIAFNELTAMREASKTGGALGAVSERELALLESALGALDTAQSGADLDGQLQKISDSITRFQQVQSQQQRGPMTATVDSRHLGHVPAQGGVKIHSITEIK